MAYTKQTWENLPSQTTPINADRLTHIEDGIFDAAATADTAASDASSAISGLADKVDKVEGKGLSTNDFTDALKTKLDNVEAGAEVNVQSDWDEDDSTSDAFILNKPTLGTSAYKNSTSVVTDSTDLVESGAVYTALQTKADNSVIGTVEDAAGASQEYRTNQRFILNGEFRRAKSPIAQGEPITDINSEAESVASIFDGISMLSISNGTDLNNLKGSIITNQGIYYANSTTAATLLNVPISGVGFRLEVKRILVGADRFVQLFYPNSGTDIDIWYRNYTSSGWSSWNKLVMTV